MTVSVDVYDLFRQLLGADIGVVVALPADTDTAEVYRLLRAVLQAAEALDAVRADDGSAVFDADVAARADCRALTAADTRIAHTKRTRFDNQPVKKGLMMPLMMRYPTLLRGAGNFRPA